MAAVSSFGCWFDAWLGFAHIAYANTVVLSTQTEYNTNMIKKIDILTLYVADHLKSSEFYESLGFKISHSGDDMAIVEIAGFKLWLVNQEAAEGNKEFEQDAFAKQKGAGLYIYINVDNIDGYYQGLVDKGYQPSNEPRDWPWGNREFVLRDPDRYKLCFYQQIVKA